ncbi:MAG: Rqc2 family fibronectin-binding protein [Acidobacteriota bacterium]
MDGFLLAALVRELQAELDHVKAGLPVGKVSAVGRDAVALDLRRRDGRWLALVVHPHDSRFYLMPRPPQGTDLLSATPFVARLRKVLRGARLVEVVKAATERSVTLTLAGFDEAERPTRWQLRQDLTGRYANLWLLTETERVVDALRPWDGLPGAPYSSPPVVCPVPNWSAVTPEELPQTAPELEAFLSNVLRGCPLRLVREVVFRASTGTPWEALESVHRALHHPQAFYLYALPEGPEVFLLPLTHENGLPVTIFTSAHEAVAALYAHEDHQASQQSLRRHWQQAIATWRKRLERAQHKLDVASAEAMEAEQYRRWGELLYANLATAKRTDQGIEVIDYYAEPPSALVIPLESPTEDIAAAAQRYFRRYQRAQRTLAANAERRMVLEAELSTALACEQELAAAKDEVALATCVEHLRHRVPFNLQPRESPPAKGTGPERAELSGLRRYRGPDGYEILVGRTARDNDRLTFELARPHDLWLHAADYPGAHVVIRNPQRQPVPAAVILAAAELAAYFSQARRDEWVDIRVAERRYLARPRKGAAGQVLVRESRTVRAMPREVLPRIV